MSFKEDIADFARVAAQGGYIYSSRADWLAANIPVTVFVSGWLKDGFRYLTVRTAGGPLTRDDGSEWSPDGKVYPNHFAGLDTIRSNSDAEASSDDWTAAIHAARDYLDSLPSEEPLYFKTQYYRVTSPIEFTGKRRLVGDAYFGSYIFCDHRSGPGVRFYNERSGFSQLSVIASDFREAGVQSFDPTTAVSTGGDTVTMTAHGFENGDVLLYSHGGDTACGGLTHRTRYYVVNKTTDTVQLSATEGGAAIDITSVGTGTSHSLRMVGQYGVLYEGTDVTPEGDASNVKNASMFDFSILGHPDDAIHIIGPAFTGSIQRFTIGACGGHGIYMDRGEKKGRTNLITGLISGVCDISRGRFSGTAGHTICLGNPNGTYTGSDYSTPCLRVEINNCEGTAGTNFDPGVYYEDATVFLRGANHVFHHNGMKGSTRAGLYVAGRNHHISNHRMLGLEDATCHAVIIGTYDELPSQEIYINGINAISPTSGMDPAVLVTLPSGESIEPKGIFINNSKTANMTTMVGTDATMGSGNENRVPGLTLNGRVPLVIKEADQTVNNTTTTVADTELTYWLAPSEDVFFHVVLQVDSSSAADFRVQITAPGGATMEYSPIGSIKPDTGSANAIQQNEVSSGIIAFGTGGVGNTRYIELRGRVTNSTTGGNLGMKWAQLTADASDTIVRAGSYISIERVEL